MNNMIFPIITETEKRLPFYLTGVGCYYQQEHIKRPEGYPAFQWIQCHHGIGELWLANNKYTIEPQQGMFLYPDIPHEYYAVKEPWEVDWIGFNGYQAEQMMKIIGFEHSGVFYISNGESVLAKMRRILTIAGSAEHFKGLTSSVAIYELLLELFKFISRGNENSVQQQRFRLQPVLDYIEDNYPQVITLEAMADTIKVSPQHLCLLFKNILKVRPFEYLNTVRINKSKDLIFSDHKLEIKNIARMVGYENVSYFCAVFKEIEGLSPGQFRKLYKLN